MSQSRRDALAFLGLAGASTAAVGTQAMGSPAPGHYAVVGQPLDRPGGIELKKISDALRKLADGIDDDEVNFIGLNVSSDIKAGSWITQVLRVEFEIDDTRKG